LKIVIASVVVVLGLVGAFAGSYILAIHALSQSDHNWCQALSLLTSHPVPKPAPGNPSRLENYEFYLDLVSLEHRFGC
jgi:hypothetical protein